MPDAAARAVFETNFWGAVRVAQEAVRFFREENVPPGGHLVQNSAACGVVGIPLLGMYTATKHGEPFGPDTQDWVAADTPPTAVEGFMSSLALELVPSWNIKVGGLSFVDHASAGTLTLA